MLHGMVGMMLIPAIAIALLVVSFFAKVPGGIRWAAIVLGLTALQIVLGIAGHATPYAGLLHGLNALALFACALYAGRAAKTVTAAATAAPEVAVSR